MPSDEDDEKLPEDDAPPRKRRRSDDEDDKPRIANSERMPLLMLLGLIVGALLILSSCGLGGWFMWGWLVAGGPGGSGGGGGGALFGNEFEVTNVSRTLINSRPTCAWTVTARKKPATGVYYFLVVRTGGLNFGEQIYPDKPGWTRSGGGPFQGLTSAGPMEVWVEKRTTQAQFGTGTIVSNTVKVP